MSEEWAEDLPYWKTRQSDPQKWLDKAATEIERAGGDVLRDGYGTHGGKAHMIAEDRGVRLMRCPGTHVYYFEMDERTADQCFASRAEAARFLVDLRDRMVKGMLSSLSRGDRR